MAVMKVQEKNGATTIVQEGNPVLRGIAHAVDASDIGTKKLHDILERMKIALEREQDGVAIAAPQIGVPLRIFIISHRAFTIQEEGGEALPDPLAKDIVVINPLLVKLSRKKLKVPEGCLSVRWLYGNTKRSEKASIRAVDEKGKAFTLGGSGLLAQIFQHEVDHLNGILFIDHATEIEELTPLQIAEIEDRNNSAKK